MLRGTGRLSTALITTIITFGVVGMPLSFYLTFKTSLGIAGTLLISTFAICFKLSVFLEKHGDTIHLHHPNDTAHETPHPPSIPLTLHTSASVLCRNTH